MRPDPLIACDDLRPVYDDGDYSGPALNLELDRTETGSGQLVSIIGPEYADKSCWLKTMCGLEHPQSGTVKLLGIEAGELTAEDWTRARMKVAYLHADTALLSAANGLSNVLAPALYHRLDEEQGRQSLTDRALSILNEIDSEIDLGILPAYLDREQCFKIAIARALLLEPDVLVLDNPFIHFDRYSRQHLQRYLGDRIDAGISILLVTTDIRYALRHSDRIIYVDKDNLCNFGSEQELRASTIDFCTNE